MTHTKHVSKGSIPSGRNGGEAHHIISEPSLFEVEDLFLFIDGRTNMQYVHQRYIFLQKRGGPSV